MKPRLGSAVVGALLVVVGALWMFDATTDIDIQWDVLLPIALFVVGAALVWGSTKGRYGGLITLGIVLTGLVMLSSAIDVIVDVQFTGGVGDRTYAPAGVADTEYRLAIGDMTVDLTAAQAPGQPIEISVGIGQLVVVVPDGTDVEVEARVGAGEVVVLGKRSSGIGPEITEPGIAPVFEIVARVGLGRLEVRTP